MNKTSRCTSRPQAVIRLKCNFIFTIIKINFFNQLGTFPSKAFCSRFNLNATIKLSTKVKKSQSAPRLRARRSSRCAFGQEQSSRRLNNKARFPTLSQTAYSLTTHINQRVIVPNKLLNLHPLSS